MPAWAASGLGALLQIKARGLAESAEGAHEGPQSLGPSLVPALRCLLGEIFHFLLFSLKYRLPTINKGSSITHTNRVLI